MTQVENLGVGDVVERVSKKRWQIPDFQREFVWQSSAITSLCRSVIKGLPCGLFTAWEIPEDENDLPLQPVCIRTAYADGRTKDISAGASEPLRKCAIIDGRQRATALSIAFGGLKDSHRSGRFSGQVFMDLDEENIDDAVSFIKTVEIEKLGLDSQAGWVETGKFPFGIDYPQDEPIDNGQILEHWTQTLTFAAGMPLSIDGVTQELLDGWRITPEIITGRKRRITKYANALTQNKIFAVFNIPDEISLGEVCESFEILNTAGTKVSAVDVVHSILFTSPSLEYEGEKFLLRKWIEGVNKTDGANGWGVPEKKVTTELVIATYLACNDPPPPRLRAGGASDIRAFKDHDLLLLPPEHWADVVERQKTDEFFSKAIEKFQRTVLDGLFPWSACPYSIVAAIYVGLWWHLKTEAPKWTEEDLNKVFKAFFWRNALSRAYEQMHSTKAAEDLIALKDLLNSSAGLAANEKRQAFEGWLKKKEFKLEPKKDLSKYIQNKKPPEKALKTALLLAMMYRPKKDIVEPTQEVCWPAHEKIQVHHVFPQKWINDHATDPTVFGEWHDKPEALKLGKNSIANKTPLLGSSNRKWASKSPGSMIAELSGTDWEEGKPIWTERFIEGSVYTQLRLNRMEDFIKRRAESMADWLVEQCKVSVD